PSSNRFQLVSMGSSQGTSKVTTGSASTVRTPPPRQLTLIHQMSSVSAVRPTRALPVVGPACSNGVIPSLVAGTSISTGDVRVSAGRRVPPDGVVGPAGAGAAGGSSERPLGALKATARTAGRTAREAGT